MYNGGDNFYSQNFPQYDNGVYDRYTNIYLPCQKTTNCLKHCNFCFSSEEEKCNKKANYILTENNRKINNNIINNSSSKNKYKILNKFITDNSSYSNSQQILRDNNYRSTTGKLCNRFKKFTRKNNKNHLFNHIYISVNPYGRNTNSISHDMENMTYNSINKNIYNLKNNSEIKKENYSIYGVNQINNSSNNESSIYYFVNNTISNNNKYNQLFIKHKSQSPNYFNYDNQNGVVNNLLYNDFTQNKIKSSAISPYNSEYKEMDFGPLTYRSENCVSITPEHNCNSEKMTKFENYQKEIYINNYLSNSKVYSSINNTESNKNENQAYKPLVNKSTNFKKIGYFNLNNRLMKRNVQKEHKKKINLVVKNIQNNYQNLILNKSKGIKNNKKISLVDVPIYNNNSVDNKNHSLYEVKSFSKDTSNQIKQKNKKIKNNAFINSGSKKKDEDDAKRKIDDKNALKVKSNINSNHKNLKEKERIKEDNLKLRTRKINLNELNSCIRNEGKIFIIQKEKHKKISNNTNKSGINNNKENININIKKSLGKNSLNNNNSIANSYTCKAKIIKNAPKIILNMNKNKLNKFQNIKLFEKIRDKNKTIIINNNFLKKTKKKVNCKKTSISSIYIENSKFKPIQFEKSSTSYISYVSSAKEKKLNIKEVKKKRRKYNRQNLIQLMNIGNKSFEEDFPFKYNSYMNKINKILKPQIAFRTSLFANKEPEKEKYYIVNFFYSENIKKKPDVVESDF